MDSTANAPDVPTQLPGMVFDLQGLYAEFEQLTDERHARGKRYSLALILLLIVLARLCGEDQPYGIA